MLHQTKDMRELLIDIDVAISRMNNDRVEGSLIEKRKIALDLVINFPNKKDERINDSTISKLLDVNHKISIYLDKNSILHSLDCFLYDMACLSNKKDSILKRFFELKEKQIIYKLKKERDINVEVISRDEILSLKIYLISRLSASRNIVDKNERKKLLELSYLRGFETNFQRLFKIKINNDVPGYKRNLLELNFNSLYYQMLLLNDNDTKSVIINEDLLENIVLGFKSIQKENTNVRTCVSDLKLEILHGSNPIRITMIAEEKHNKDVCKLLVKKFHEFLSNVCVKESVNDIYEFMFIKGKELGVEIREMKLKSILLETDNNVIKLIDNKKDPKVKKKI